jgi:hypothetical protein
MDLPCSTRSEVIVQLLNFDPPVTTWHSGELVPATDVEASTVQPGSVNCW